MAVSYLGEQLADLPFIPFAIFDGMARLLPGDVLTAGIDFMVTVISALQVGPTSEVAKAIERILAVGMMVLLGAALGALLGHLGRDRREQLVAVGARVGVVYAVIVALATMFFGYSSANPLASTLWFGLLLVGWGSTLGWLIRLSVPAPAAQSETTLSRRAFVTAVGGGAIGISLGAWGLGLLISPEDDSSTGIAAESLPASIELPEPTAQSEELADRIQPAPGTRPELTSNEDFYRIDINTRDPRLEADTWRLEVGGLVDNPLSLSLADLQAMPAVTQTITLSCISNRIGGDLIGTSRWTGVRMVDLLELAQVRPEGKELFIEAADGFYESVAMEDLMDERTLLVYGMNGLPLPVEHGFPLRIYIPNRYGMKQPKWIARMEIIDHTGEGYWVDRGWSEEARVRTTSVIDTVGEDATEETVPVGGIAYSGARGISKVEVQVDEGPWLETQIRVPPLSSLTWVQWRFDWPYAPGRHTFRVRAYDGQGEMQTLTPSGVRPDGATGIHEVTKSL